MHSRGGTWVDQVVPIIGKPFENSFDHLRSLRRGQQSYPAHCDRHHRSGERREDVPPQSRSAVVFRGSKAYAGRVNPISSSITAFGTIGTRPRFARLSLRKTIL